MEYAQVLPQLVVGTFPQGIEDVERLQRETGITAVLNLQTDEELRERHIPWEQIRAYYSACGIEVCRMPVRDEVPSLREKLPDCVRALRQLREAGHSVYVHCTFGAGRSPTVAVAYLHWCLGWDLDAAATHMIRLRTCTPSVEAIRGAAWPPADEPSPLQPLPWKHAS